MSNYNSADSGGSLRSLRSMGSIGSTTGFTRSPGAYVGTSSAGGSSVIRRRHTETQRGNAKRANRTNTLKRKIRKLSNTLTDIRQSAVRVQKNRERKGKKSDPKRSLVTTNTNNNTLRRVATSPESGILTLDKMRQILSNLRNVSVTEGNRRPTGNINANNSATLRKAFRNAWKNFDNTTSKRFFYDERQNLRGKVAPLGGLNPMNRTLKNKEIVAAVEKKVSRKSAFSRLMGGPWPNYQDERYKYKEFVERLVLLLRPTKNQGRTNLTHDTIVELLGKEIELYARRSNFARQVLDRIVGTLYPMGMGALSLGKRTVQKGFYVVKFTANIVIRFVLFMLSIEVQNFLRHPLLIAVVQAILGPLTMLLIYKRSTSTPGTTKNKTD